uniref:superoxide dismutase n=1 Tax=Ixodes ricinus TaxID=34613 RepID=A0A147BME9_IXORI
MLVPSLLLLALATVTCQSHGATPIYRGVAVLNGGPVRGRVEFIKENPYVQVQVLGNVTGLSPGHHGFHVHRFGDLSAGCPSAGPHFNPGNTVHGAPEDDYRHVGDLGNIEADANGIAVFNFYDRLLEFEGGHGIIGRAVVVHERQDDLGRTTHPESRSTGNAGGRLTCGVIGFAKP